MLTADQREQVPRAYFIEGKNIRRIAREGLHDRRTVRKFLRDAGPPRYTLRFPGAALSWTPFWPSSTGGSERMRADRPSNATLATAYTAAWSRSLVSKAESLPSGNTFGSAGLGGKC